ncbi:hypothetical protein PTI98_011863 [Pleurotus ostreatus]|nr:hypothetical protein PTI98_011863 [Pleurotus ostreatus]
MTPAPSPHTLKELEKRPETPVRQWHNLDGLDDNAHNVPSLASARAQLAARKQAEMKTVSATIAKLKADNSPRPPSLPTADRAKAAIGQESSERAKELYAAYAFEISPFWRIDELPLGVASIDGLIALLRETVRKIPFAVNQILHTWTGGRAVYWLQFGDEDQALRVRGYLARSRNATEDSCEGPLVPKTAYQLALAEVRQPKERPSSPTVYWNLPVSLDV